MKSRLKMPIGTNFVLMANNLSEEHTTVHSYVIQYFTFMQAMTSTTAS